MRKKPKRKKRARRPWLGWLPPPEPLPKPVTHVYRAGEPALIPLVRWPYDQALRGQFNEVCCECSLKHLFTYEVFRDASGHYFLKLRSYRIGKRGRSNG